MSAVVISACSWVLVTNVVARSLAFHRTTDELMKFVPVAVSVNPAPPATMLVGAMDVSVGLGFTVIVNVCALEAPPPGVGVNTVTDAVPPAAMSAVVIWAWSWVRSEERRVGKQAIHRRVGEVANDGADECSENA